MKPKIIIIGAGGHGKVLANTLLLENNYEIVGFVDETVPVGTRIFKEYEVIAKQKNITELTTKAAYFIVAIGNNEIRNAITTALKNNFKLATIIHPTAFIGADVEIGEGTVVLANAVISTCTKIGSNAIINAGVVIDHDCIVGNNVHLSVGTIVGSNTVIGSGITTAVGQKINSFSKID